MEEFYEQLIENDLNPFILFDSKGKILKFNKEADFLLSFVPYEKIYELALNYAPKTFGFKKEFLPLKFNKERFYAILVGYLDIDKIGIKLYKEVIGYHKNLNFDQKKQQKTNLFMLLELSKNSTFLNQNIEFKEIFDLSIPEIKLDIDIFLKLFNKIFSQFKNSEKIIIEVGIKTGEYIHINRQKLKVCYIKIDGKMKLIDKEKLYDYADKAQYNLEIEDNKILVELPLLI